MSALGSISYPCAVSPRHEHRTEAAAVRCERERLAALAALLDDFEALIAGSAALVVTAGEGTERARIAAQSLAAVRAGVDALKKKHGIGGRT